jgi:hypothetical protein
MTKPDPDAPADTIRAAALAHAKRWNLVCENGQIFCMRERCEFEATLPSLLCAAHLAERTRGER